MANLVDTPALIPEALFLPTGLSQALESIAETQRQFSQIMETVLLPIQRMQREITLIMEPIRQVQQMLENSPLLRMTQKIQESNRRMAELMTIRPVIPYFGYEDVIDGEIKEETKISTPNQVETAIVLQPTMLPVLAFPLPVVPRGKMGLSLTKANTFVYKRKRLKNLSARNTEGRLLALIFKNDFFIADETIHTDLYIKTGRSFSWVLRNLKNKFKKNGLKIWIERCWDPNGYIVTGIEYLQ